nr:immunoglobulin heavy chain junction region [Macaca mulatta]
CAREGPGFGLVIISRGAFDFW